MKHLEGLFEELKIEVEKASSCYKYAGVVFVHPDDVESVSRFICSLRSSEYNTQKKIFKFESGGTLRLYTFGRNISELLQRDYTCCELTTALIHRDCFGKCGYYKNLEVNCNVNCYGGDENFIMHMIKRSRSQSKFPARLVYV